MTILTQTLTLNVIIQQTEQYFSNKYLLMVLHLLIMTQYYYQYLQMVFHYGEFQIIQIQH